MLLSQSVSFTDLPVLALHAWMLLQVSVVKQYVSHLASGEHRDIVCIAESALAIMQARLPHLPICAMHASSLSRVK